jgi:uncharacterized cupredoxin-like copper-binding protein
MEVPVSEFRALLLLGSLLAISVLLVACGGDDDDDDGDDGTSTTVNAVVREWEVVPDISSGPAGEFAFDVDNRGPMFPHQFKVIRTDLAHDALPVVGDQVDETAVEVVFELETFESGRFGRTTLTAGNYVLICNLPTHYEQGMSAPFTVE